MFSVRNLALAGTACIPVLGLLFGVFIGLAWLRTMMAIGYWRVLPMALFVAAVYLVLNILVFAPVMADSMAIKWVLAFLFTAWGVSYVGGQLDQAQSQAVDSSA
ncbi:hypothetical protein KBW71_01125 [Hydrogenophaga aromaticivorans]|uniref:hypothetical protein n=1 Tax=Hydrogenophaga aromaticivorans TaxID=2610898 RepID=UPI000CACE5FD|nr:hypothetical protein [Hydrogenophaga aromaticivorans]MBQ0917032.1 hypothetical protein [Hydrogenophaga aromaticivorans]PKO59078.1 MAG: hypothetical protein CVU24_16040 [Betaproteobacteria bacterium HGW-Betaproteobacteria-18]